MNELFYWTNTPQLAWLFCLVCRLLFDGNLFVSAGRDCKAAQCYMLSDHSTAVPRGERTHTHTHTHTLSLSLTLTHSLSLTHTHTHTLTHSLSHTHAHTHTLSLSHTHTHTHALPPRAIYTWIIYSRGGHQQRAYNRTPLPRSIFHTVLF